MDYSQYNKLEFRRKFWKFLGVNISVYDPNSNDLVGFINQKTFMLKPDVFLYTDTTMSTSVLELKKQTMMKMNPKYSVIDPKTQQDIAYLSFNDFKSYLTRWHINLLDQDGQAYGYIQETSGFLAILRRWIALINDGLALILMFVPQTFNIYLNSDNHGKQLVGKITHRKNPIIVKMGLDLSQAEVTIDPRINLAICSLLMLRDINKNA
jgi:hypothetical protein